MNIIKSEKESLSQFSYEYLIALLMNLAASTKGKEAFEKET